MSVSTGGAESPVLKSPPATGAVSKMFPSFMEEVRNRYRADEASVFILQGNVFDEFLHDGRFYSVSELLVELLKDTKTSGIALYDPSLGITFADKGVDQTLAVSPADAVPLARLENWFKAKHAGAAIVSYASLVVPAGDDALLAADDRAASARVHRWSLSDWMVKRNNVVFLLTETLAEIHPRLLSNPRIGVVQIPLPTLADRQAIIAATTPNFTGPTLQRLAEQTSGLRGVHLRQIFALKPTTGLDEAGRLKYIRELLAGSPYAETRALKFASVTSNMTLAEIRDMIQSDKSLPENKNDELAEIAGLVRRRKKEIIEKECAGLLEVVEPGYGLEAVGGNEAVPARLRRVIEAIQSGDASRVPMGILFVGPMGTGKTFVAKAFAGSCGVAAVSFKNFRSKWVGSSEGNLERVLSTIKAMGPVVVLIDEGDRSFGNGGGEGGDDGTSSRIIARLKEFMSDPENRGRVLFIMMTNRPDKLDTDIKRAGRFDLKIPFFYVDTDVERQSLLATICKRYGVPVELCTILPWGYSSADYEAVVLETASRGRAEGRAITAQDFADASGDYLPSKDGRMLQFMELLAVFEASSRSLVPERYRSLSADELNARLDEARLKSGIR